MRWPLILLLAALSPCTASGQPSGTPAAAADSSVTPALGPDGRPGGRYLVPRGLVVDYVVCASEASLWRASAEALAGQASAASREADTWRQALAASEASRRLTGGRLAVAQASASAERSRRAEAERSRSQAERSRRRAERSRGRWRAVALAGPVAVGAVGVVVGVLVGR